MRRALIAACALYVSRTAAAAHGQGTEWVKTAAVQLHSAEHSIGVTVTMDPEVMEFDTFEVAWGTIKDLARQVCEVTKQPFCYDDGLQAQIGEGLMTSFILAQPSFSSRHPNDLAVRLEKDDELFQDHSFHASKEGENSVNYSTVRLFQRNPSLDDPENFRQWLNQSEATSAAISKDYNFAFLKIGKNAGTAVMNGYLHRALCPPPPTCKAVRHCFPRHQFELLELESAEDNPRVSTILGQGRNRTFPYTKCSKAAFRRGHSLFSHSLEHGY